MVLCFPSIPISISRPQRWKDILFRFGEDKYFKYPLPDLIQTVRRAPCSLPKDFAMTIDQQTTNLTVTISKYFKGHHTLALASRVISVRRLETRWREKLKCRGSQEDVRGAVPKMDYGSV